MTLSSLELKAVASLAKILKDESMRTWTTFHCESHAKYFLEPKSVEELQKVIRFFHDQGFTWKKDWDILGNGSNLLVRDEGFEGVLLHLAKEFFSDIHVLSDGADAKVKVSVGAGLLNGKLLQWCRERQYTGFEFAFGIPGTIGGGIRMNAGTPQGWFSQIVKKVRWIDMAGHIENVEVSEGDFSYRRFSLSDDKIIVGCELELVKSDVQTVEDAIAQSKHKRKNQPLEFPNFGSVFKNPEGDFSGRLIEGAGLKGFRLGQAQISEKHSNFIINHGHAATGDALMLIEKAQQAVLAKYGILLEPEVVVIGGKQT